MFEKFFIMFGTYAEQREMNFAHAVAAACLITVGILYRIFA